VSHSEKQVVVGDRGRLVLPSAVRSALDLKPGTRMLVTTEPDGSVRLRPFRSVADRNLGMFADVAPGVSMVDELIAERRAEAAREDAE
jgi:AbrB family looped-hinge helix DNA binding protein